MIANTCVQSSAIGICQADYYTEHEIREHWDIPDLLMEEVKTAVRGVGAHRQVCLIKNTLIADGYTWFHAIRILNFKNARTQSSQLAEPLR